MGHGEESELREPAVSNALSRSVSRREFLKIAGVAGASVGLAGGLGSLLAACGSDSQTATTAAGTVGTASVGSTTPAGVVTTTGALPTKTLKVGFIGAMSGPKGALGLPFSYGCELAVKHINEDGWFVANGTKYVIELLKYDDRSDAKVTANIAQQMVSDGVKFAVISTPNWASAQQITEPNKVILVGPGFPADYTKDVKGSTKYSFATSYSTWLGKAVRRAMAAPGKEDDFTILKNITRVGLLAEQGPTPELWVNSFATECERLGGDIQVAYKGVAAPDTSDFTSVIEAVKQADPSVLFCSLGFTATTLVVYPQMRDAGFTKQIVGADNISGRGPDNRKIATDAANGVVEETYFFPSWAEIPEWGTAALGFDPAARDRYNRDFIATYGAKNEGAGAVHGYDFMTVGLKHCAASGAPQDPDACVEQFEKGEPVAGAMAQTVWFPENHRFPLPLLFVRLKDIDTSTGAFGMDFLGGGRPLDVQVDLDWPNAKWDWHSSGQVDVTQLS
jgi:ABC-type branched-subunit amino acid transport system substrate-binding protein